MNCQQKLHYLHQLSGIRIQKDVSTSIINQNSTVTTTFGDSTIGNYSCTSTRPSIKLACEDNASNILEQLKQSGMIAYIEKKHKDKHKDKVKVKYNFVDTDNILHIYTHQLKSANNPPIIIDPTNPSELNKIILFKRFVNKNKYFGVDTEGTNNTIIPLLVQISTCDKITFLFRMIDPRYRMKNAIYPEYMRNLFENPDKVKFIFGKENLGNAKNIKDVQQLAMNTPLIKINLDQHFKQKDGNVPSLVNVVSIVRYILDDEPTRMKRIVKDRKLTMCDWSRQLLTENQIRYAVADSWLTLQCGLYILRS